MNKSNPLVVDLDGSLIHTDLTFESIFLFLKGYPQQVFSLFFWFLKGRAYFKRQLAQRISMRVDLLPYNQDVLAYLKEQKRKGRSLILATGSDILLAQEVARYLDLFDDVIASDGKINMRSHTKAQKLISLFGEKNFGYVGNSRHDLPVWNKAADVIAVNPPTWVLRKLEKTSPPLIEFKTKASLRENIIRSLRPHQLVKNLLVFLPLLSSHQVTNTSLILNTVIAFFAFSLSSSAIYLLNDLFDLDADRSHPIKSLRPLARGVLPIPIAFVVSLSLLSAAGLLSLFFLPLGVFMCLIAYIGTTTLYSLFLKQYALIDVITLASLYVLRVIVGYEATGLAYSNWLLALSLFFFLSLAFMKRYVELRTSITRPKAQNKLPGRGYSQEDEGMIAIFGIVNSYLTVLVLALYIESPIVPSLYPNAWVLWFLCPLFIYFFSRLWLVAHRGGMSYDPVLHILKDKSAHLIVFLAVGVVLAASLDLEGALRFFHTGTTFR